MGIRLPMVGSNTVSSAGSPSLFSKTRQALLGLLYVRADEERLQESLIRLAGLGRGTVQRELEFLARAGVVRRTLRGLVVKTGGVADAPASSARTAG